MSMLEVRAIRAGYGRLTVLFDLEFSVEPGEWVTILGANGAGRSTLLKAILGVVNCADGEILFRGERITHHSPHRRVAAGMSMSPEGRRVFPNLSVEENLIAGTHNIRARGDVKTQMHRVFDVFPKLMERSRQRAGSLSGGEQQMLAIGRALMSQPRLLLVDELSLGLAPIIVESMFSSLDELRASGLSLVVVDQLHAHESLARHSDRQLILEKGRFVSENALDVAELAGAF